MSVTLLDYGVGNVASVRRAFARLGAEVELTKSPERVAAARRIVLPGVGAFAPARERLAASGLEGALHAALASGARLVGLCLGFQLLFEESAEFGTTNIGWNGLALAGSAELLSGVPEGSAVYFVHSFRAEGEDSADVAARCDYGGGFPAAIEKGNVWGCQFHPEKSSEVGRRILRNFLDGDAS